MASQVVLVKKNLPSNEEDVRDVGSLGWKNPLEEGMATPFSILAWRSQSVFWPEEFHELVHVVTNSQTPLSDFHFHFAYLFTCLLFVF